MGSDETSSVREFFTLLAICNTVVVSSSSDQQPENYVSLGNEPSTQNQQTCVDGRTNDLYLNGRISNLTSAGDIVHEKQLTYEAESPDEAALVKSASMYGYKLMSRSPDSITIEVPGVGVVKYHLLHVLVFDSTRKRMSVIVRREDDNQILMYCKGADTSILSQLSKACKGRTFRSEETLEEVDRKDSENVSLMERTETHLNIYAKEGLRTLCMAKKVRSVVKQFLVKIAIEPVHFRDQTRNNIR